MLLKHSESIRSFWENAVWWKYLFQCIFLLYKDISVICLLFGRGVVVDCSGASGSGSSFLCKVILDCSVQSLKTRVTQLCRVMLTRLQLPRVFWWLQIWTQWSFLLLELNPCASLSELLVFWISVLYTRRPSWVLVSEGILVVFN